MGAHQWRGAPRWPTAGPGWPPAWPNGSLPARQDAWRHISARHLQLLSPHMDAMRGIAMFADCGKEFQEMLNSRWA